MKEELSGRGKEEGGNYKAVKREYKKLLYVMRRGERRERGGIGK